MGRHVLALLLEIPALLDAGVSSYQAGFSVSRDPEIGPRSWDHLVDVNGLRYRLPNETALWGHGVMLVLDA